MAQGVAGARKLGVPAGARWRDRQVLSERVHKKDKNHGELNYHMAISNITSTPIHPWGGDALGRWRQGPGITWCRIYVYPGGTIHLSLKLACRQDRDAILDYDS